MLLMADLSGWGEPLSSLHRHACMFSHLAHNSKPSAEATEAGLADLAGLRGCEAQRAQRNLLIADLSCCADSLLLLTCMAAEANAS